MGSLSWSCRSHLHKHLETARKTRLPRQQLSSRKPRYNSQYSQFTTSIIMGREWMSTSFIEIDWRGCSESGSECWLKCPRPAQYFINNKVVWLQSNKSIIYIASDIGFVFKGTMKDGLYWIIIVTWSVNSSSAWISHFYNPPFEVLLLKCHSKMINNKIKLRFNFIWRTKWNLIPTIMLLLQTNPGMKIP